MRPPVSRVCFNNYCNFTLAERHCQIGAFKGNSCYGGCWNLCTLAQSFPAHVSTYWLPQTMLHAVLTLLSEGSKTCVLTVSTPARMLWESTEGLVYLGKTMVSSIDARTAFPPGHRQPLPSYSDLVKELEENTRYQTEVFILFHLLWIPTLYDQELLELLHVGKNILYVFWMVLYFSQCSSVLMITATWFLNSLPFISWNTIMLKAY